MDFSIVYLVVAVSFERENGRKNWHMANEPAGIRHVEEIFFEERDSRWSSSSMTSVFQRQKNRRLFPYFALSADFLLQVSSVRELSTSVEKDVLHPSAQRLPHSSFFSAVILSQYRTAAVRETTELSVK